MDVPLAKKVMGWWHECLNFDLSICAQMCQGDIFSKFPDASDAGLVDHSRRSKNTWQGSAICRSLHLVED